jgi:hypothetical protein
VHVPAVAAADHIDTSGVAMEQSFNREQVQEQEQVRCALPSLANKSAFQILVFISIFYSLNNINIYL